MSPLWSIARSTFVGIIRDRLSLLLLAFTLLMLALITAMSAGSLHEEARLIKDVGIFLTSSFAVLSSLFVGAQLLHRELEGRTLYLLLPKPLSRSQFLLGKYLGMALSSLLLITLMDGALYLLSSSLGVDWDAAMYQALIACALELLMICAVSFAFGSFSSPLFAGALSLGFFLVGRFIPELNQLLEKRVDGAYFIEGVSRQLLEIARLLIPDLSRYDLTSAAVYDGPLPWAYLGWLALSAISYSGLALLVAALLFQRRDLH
ncbi:MAG: ABC transporter permease subunit [Myxococcota bacterium]|nr:ABC transporter permease subunit [Myxococcota bacterium]